MCRQVGKGHAHEERVLQKVLVLPDLNTSQREEEKVHAVCFQAKLYIQLFHLYYNNDKLLGSFPLCFGLQLVN